MSNQSFDSHGTSPANDTDSAAVPIPIVQQLKNNTYLCSIQHQKEALLNAAEVEDPEERLRPGGPSSSAKPHEATPHEAPLGQRANKMDSFFERAAAEEKAAAEVLASQPSSRPQHEDALSNFSKNTPEDFAPTAPAASDNTQPQVTHAPLHLTNRTSETAAEKTASAEVPPAETRPTGQAGLAAGLAAAGLASLGSRLADRSNPQADEGLTTKRNAQASAHQPELPSPPLIPVVDPSFSALSFDLEAARLEEVSGPVFSQEFEEKELSPQERLENRLKRENLVSSESTEARPTLKDHTSPSLESEPEITAPHDDGAVVDNARPIDGTLEGVGQFESVAASPSAPLGESEPAPAFPEPVMDLYVEVPQIPTAPEVNIVNVHLPNDQSPAPEQADVSDSYPDQKSAANSGNAFLNSPAIPDGNSQGPSVLDSGDMTSQNPVSPEPSRSDAPQDPRLMEAKLLEEQFRQLQDQEKHYLEQAQQEGVEHAISRAENSRVDSETHSLPLPADLLPPAVEDKAAAFEQAARVKDARVKDARVKDARDKANASAHQASPAAISVEPDDHQQSQLAPLPQPSDQGSDDPFSPATVSQSSEATPEAQSSALEGMAAAQNHDSTVEPLDAKQHFEYELFHSCVLDYLSDGVIFVDHNQRVKVWSQGAEKATGIIPSAVLNRQLLPQTIRLCDTNGNHLQLDKCPVARSLRTLQIVSGEFKIANSSTQGGMKVELTSIPVIDKNRYVSGAVVMFHDRTAQVNLQRQLKDLYEFSVLDPLTQVANRAEFERVQQEYVLAFQQSDDFNCSIIICDIDFFKSINDNFGHTVGDEALMAFAEMLKRYVRPQDLVARYGGEEFVILCADCDKNAAVQRAEEIRIALFQTPQPMLDGKSISASFGVSELREGDTATDFFVRADTALLQAKETGRNRVVAEDGSPVMKAEETATELSPTGIRWRAQQRKNSSLICEEFQTETPIQVLVEKLRGYIIENDAVLQRVEPEFLSMEIQVESPTDYSRKGAFTMNVELKENEAEDGNSNSSNSNRTKTLNYIRVTIYAGRMRKWFSTNHVDLAPHLLSELRRFLMIGDKAARLTVDLATHKVR